MTQLMRDIAQTYKVRALPATAFAAFGIVPRTALAPGRAIASEPITAHALRVHAGLIGAGEVWVDPVNGNDANAGTIASPIKTVNHGLRDLAPSNVYCVPGVYDPFEFRSTDTPGNKLKILHALGPCYVRNAADSASGATWTPDGTLPIVYWMPLTPGNRPVVAVLDSGRTDEEGQPRTLAKGASIAAIDTAGEGWFHDTGANRLYVRFMGSVNVNTIKARLQIVTGDAGGRVLLYGAKLLMRGDWRLQGVNLNPTPLGGAVPSLYIDAAELAPTVAYAAGHGLDAQGAITAGRLWVHASVGDNLHYADSAGLACQAIELDCVSTDAGNVAGNPTAPNTSNASSIHDATNILRINGQYRNSYGPDIVDTGTGKSWLVGCQAGPSRASGNGYGIYTTGPEMWVDTCAALGQAQADLAAVTGGTMRVFATAYRTSTVDGTGRILPYKP